MAVFPENPIPISISVPKSVPEIGSSHTPELLHIPVNTYFAVPKELYQPNYSLLPDGEKLRTAKIVIELGNLKLPLTVSIIRVIPLDFEGNELIWGNSDKQPLSTYFTLAMELGNIPSQVIGEINAGIKFGTSIYPGDSIVNGYPKPADGNETISIWKYFSAGKKGTLKTLFTEEELEQVKFYVIDMRQANEGDKDQLKVDESTPLDIKEIEERYKLIPITDEEKFILFEKGDSLFTPDPQDPTSHDNYGKLSSRSFLPVLHNTSKIL